MKGALERFVELDREAEKLETADCSCADFFCCPNCERLDEITTEMNRIGKTWGRHFAYALAERMGLIQTELEAL